MLEDEAWSCEGEKHHLGMGDLLWHEVFGRDLEGLELISGERKG